MMIVNLSFQRIDADLCFGNAGSSDGFGDLLPELAHRPGVVGHGGRCLAGGGGFGGGEGAVCADEIFCKCEAAVLVKGLAVGVPGAGLLGGPGGVFGPRLGDGRRQKAEGSCDDEDDSHGGLFF